MKPYYQDDFVTLYHGEALDCMASLAPASVELLACDPPYFRKVDADWDDQWGTDVTAFLSWIGEVIDAALPLVVARGTFAMFAAPDYAAGVEMEWRARATVLNHIVWDKPIGRLGQASIPDMRRFFPQSERIIIAEHRRGPDLDLFRFVDHVNHAVARDVYADIRAQLVSLRDAAGLTNREIDAALGRNGMAGHYFGASQWSLPTREAWGVISELMRVRGVVPPEFDALRAEFDALRAEFDALRAEFDGRRAEFDGRRAEFDGRRREFDGRRAEFDKKLLSDVWSMPTIRGGERTEHPTQKPIRLMDHLVGTLSRSGDTVLDPFAGSGSTLVAAKALGRKAIGVELEERYCEIAANRLAQDALPIWDLGGAA